MGISYNPRVATDGLVFALDVASKKCISPIGCTGFNNAPQLVKNLVSTSDTIDSYNGVKLGNLNYYTVFAIDYPETSYGGSAAGRDGITPGYNVTSGTKTFDFGRALNYAVYNNPTQSWVKTTVYDSYVGTAAVNTFVSEYATAVVTYPDAVHIVSGSHRDSYHTTAQYDILRDLGAPSNVDSIINFSSPEWILVGKPGLGAGNAYAWAFQNYSTNSTQVAHVNFGLPIYGNIDNYLEFDGVDDYVECGSGINSNISFGEGKSFTIEIVFETNNYSSNQSIIARRNSDSSGFTDYQVLYENGVFLFGTGSSSDSGAWRNLGTAFSINNKIMHFCGVVNSTGAETGTKITYKNGVQIDSTSYATKASPTANKTFLGKYNGSGYYFNGKIYVAKIYNRALTAAEVQQNFNATRSRYSI